MTRSGAAWHRPDLGKAAPRRSIWRPRARWCRSPWATTTTGPLDEQDFSDLDWLILDYNF